MTETKRKRLGPGPVAFGSGAVFLGVFAGLALQLGAGEDPALGSGSEAAAPEPKQVLVRRVIKRRVVVRVLPPKGQPAGGGSQPAGGAPAGGGGSVPAEGSAPSAPAPAPAAPAPAPAPAPVTRSS
jgi:hypothetical protein